MRSHCDFIRRYHPVLLVLGVSISTLTIPQAWAAEVSFDPGSYPYTLAADGGGTSTLSGAETFDGTQSAQFTLPSYSSSGTSNSVNDFAKVIANGNFGTLANFVGSFETFVAATSGTNLPYMYVGVDVNGDGTFDSSLATDAFVIVFNSGASCALNTWCQQGLNSASNVQVTGARPGLGATQFSSSAGGGLLSALDTTSDLSGDWGDLNVLQVRVGAGEWPGTTAAFNAYIDDIEVPAVPEPATLGLLGIGFAGIVAARRRRPA